MQRTIVEIGPKKLKPEHFCLPLNQRLIVFIKTIRSICRSHIILRWIHCWYPFRCIFIVSHRQRIHCIQIFIPQYRNYFQWTENWCTKYSYSNASAKRYSVIDTSLSGFFCLTYVRFNKWGTFGPYSTWLTMLIWFYNRYKRPAKTKHFTFYVF